MLNNEASAASVVSLADIAARTTNLNGSWVDVRAYEGDLLIVLDIGAVSGTTPTLDVKIQDATDGSGTGAADITGAAFAQATTANQRAKLVIPAGAPRSHIRVVGTVGGTTPNFTYSVTLLSRQKYV